jgi:glycosyltransferase involved in cell wall biosynthesis
MMRSTSARTQEYAVGQLDVMADPIELTILLPCLNEAETLAACLRKAQMGLERANVRGEVLVADNGSTDGSIEIAKRHGARVVHVRERGYGSALRGGVAAARGRYVIMGDADDSYDFLEIGGFVQKLRAGSELVMGCRLPKGGGTIMPGACSSNAPPTTSTAASAAFRKRRSRRWSCRRREWSSRPKS